MKDETQNREEAALFESAAENAIASAANIGLFSQAIQQVTPVTLLTPLTQPDLFVSNYNNRDRKEENKVPYKSL